MFTGALGSAFEVGAMVIVPGRATELEQGGCRGAIVIVESGELEIESVSGARQVFQRGSVMYLASPPMLGLRSTSLEPTLLSVVARRPP